jgi:hypothetical protein
MKDQIHPHWKAPRSTVSVSNHGIVCRDIGFEGIMSAVDGSKTIKYVFNAIPFEYQRCMAGVDESNAVLKEGWMHILWRAEARKLRIGKYSYATLEESDHEGIS